MKAAVKYVKLLFPFAVFTRNVLLLSFVLSSFDAFYCSVSYLPETPSLFTEHMSVFGNSSSLSVALLENTAKESLFQIHIFLFKKATYGEVLLGKMIRLKFSLQANPFQTIFAGLTLPKIIRTF